MRVVLNPEAGGVSRHPGIVDALARLPDARVLRTRAAGHAAELARRAVRDGARTIVAAGGDGTVHEVVNGMRGADAALGIVPLGTGNDICRGLGLPLDPAAALERLRAGEVRRVDLLEVTPAEGEEPRRVVNFVLGGFAGDVARHATPRRRRRWGRWVYLRAVLAELRTVVPYDVELTVDGGEPDRRTLLAVVIANGGWLGAGIPLLPGADPADGRLDLVALEGRSRRDVLALLPRLLAGRHLAHPRVRHLRARRVELHARPPMPLNADGQALGRGGFVAEVLPGALAVVAPGP